MTDFVTWSCKVVVPKGTALPPDFDNPPRKAALQAIQAVVGDAVVVCFSGWGGTLSASEREFAESVMKPASRAAETK